MTSSKPRGTGERPKAALRPLRDEVSDMLGSFRDMLGSFRGEHARMTTDLERRLRGSTADRQREVRDMLSMFHRELFARFQKEGDARRFRYGRGPTPCKAPEPAPRREAQKPAPRAEPSSTAAGRTAAGGPRAPASEGRAPGGDGGGTTGSGSGGPPGQPGPGAKTP